MLNSFHQMLVASGALRRVLLLLLHLLPWVFLCHDLLPFLLVEGPPHSWVGIKPSCSPSIHAQFVVELVSSPLLLYSWSVLCWAATQVLLVVVCLELTWMLPRSLLRYHEKIHGSLLSLLLQCVFSLLGSDLLSLQAITPGLLNQNAMLA